MNTRNEGVKQPSLISSKADAEMAGDLSAETTDPIWEETSERWW